MQTKNIHILVFAVSVATALPLSGQINWTAVTAPVQSTMSGGPWTLAQGAPSTTYCIDGVQQPNNGVNLMQPYYFPFVIGRGQNLQGYFDYRPRNINEATVAASSMDGGRTWQFQQIAQQLTNDCPTTDANNNGDDNGQGHPYILSFGGARWLYLLDRRDGHIDSDGLVIHRLTPTADAPLNPLPPPPALRDFPINTVGLANPDGIIAEVPGTYPREIIYLKKTLSGDLTFPVSQQCGPTPAGRAANHDVEEPRLAVTYDGVNFTDIGPVNGLNDPRTTSYSGTRYLAPNGSLIQLPTVAGASPRYGLFFAGGNCLNGDSDGFQYTGYAESSDLTNWTVLNDVNSPIASVASVTAPDPVTGETVTVPANAPVVGAAQTWFAGRVYSPNAIVNDANTINLIFTGYHTAQPSNDLTNYRSIGQVVLSSGAQPLQ